MEENFSFRANFALSTFCWADLNKKLKVGRAGGWRAAVEGFNGKVIDYNENFSQTYSLGYFEIFCIVEATYSKNMKPMCRFNQLCKFKEAYFSVYLFEI